MSPQHSMDKNDLKLAPIVVIFSSQRVSTHRQITLVQENSSRPGYPLQRVISMHQDSSVLRLGVNTVTDSPFPAGTKYFQAPVCAFPATTPTRPEFHTLTSPEDHNALHPVPLLANPNKLHDVPFRRNEQVKFPRVASAMVWRSASHHHHHQTSQHLDSSKRKHRTEQERCKDARPSTLI